MAYGIQYYFLLQYIYTGLIATSLVICSVSTEYCIKDTFRAKCPDGEVIIMTHALYGRMKIGKCVTVDLGELLIAYI